MNLRYAPTPAMGEPGRFELTESDIAKLNMAAAKLLHDPVKAQWMRRIHKAFGTISSANDIRTVTDYMQILWGLDCVDRHGVPEAMALAYRDGRKIRLCDETGQRVRVPASYPYRICPDLDDMRGAVQHLLVLYYKPVVEPTPAPVPAVRAPARPSIDKSVREESRRARAMRSPVADHRFKRFSRPDLNGVQTGYRCECTSCGKIFELPSSGFLDETQIARKLTQIGWAVTAKKAICADCNPIKPKEREPDMAAEKPREMSSAHGRTIFREIDDNWDEKLTRYRGSTTDQTIADKLDVPRAWVEQIRKRDFGESGRNEQYDKVIGDLKNLRGEIERAMATAFETAGKLETLGQRVAEALQKIGEA